MGLCRITAIVTVNCAEDNMFVAVSTRCILKDGFKPHARPTSSGPEINHHCLRIFDNFGQMGLVLNFADFTDDRLHIGSLSLNILSRLAWVVVSHVAKLIQHRLEVRVHLSRLLLFVLLGVVARLLNLERELLCTFSKQGVRNDHQALLSLH